MLGAADAQFPGRNVGAVERVRCGDHRFGTNRDVTWMQPGRTSPVQGGIHALDYRDRVVGVVGVGTGQRVHHGRVHPPAAGRRRHHRAGAPDLGEERDGGRFGMRRLARWVVPAVLLAWWASPALAAAQLPGPRPVAAATAPAESQSSTSPASAATPAADYAARES